MIHRGHNDESRTSHLTSPGSQGHFSGEDGDLVSACGLDCQQCDLRLAPADAKAADRAVSWLKEMGWLAEGEGLPEARARGVSCDGCRAGSSGRWPAECWIRRCVEARNLSRCCDCRQFACHALLEWAEQNPRFGEAIDRLRADRRRALPGFPRQAGSPANAEMPARTRE